MAGILEALSRRANYTNLHCPLSDLQLEKVPRENSNDGDPVWMGDTIYFLSDRTGRSRSLPTTPNPDCEAVGEQWLRLKSVNAGRMFLSTNNSAEFICLTENQQIEHVNIQIAADLPRLARIGLKSATNSKCWISPTGARAVF